jgi:hypothetical protein
MLHLMVDAAWSVLLSVPPLFLCHRELCGMAHLVTDLKLISMTYDFLTVFVTRHELQLWHLQIGRHVGLLDDGLCQHSS